MNVVSLCSGVGLIDLGLEWAGMRTVQLCEINEFAQEILSERFPGVPIHPDAWTITPKECDVIAAGFPCQPFSLAGKGLGADDHRHLWPAIIRAICMARPRYVILENVPGLVNRGLGDVLGDLADAGFDAEWTVFGAADVGAPHLRRRVWIVATSDTDRVRVWDEQGGFFRQGWGSAAIAWAHGQARPMADTGRERLEGQHVTAPQFDDAPRCCPYVADADEVGRHGRTGARDTTGREEPTDSGLRVPDTDSGTVQPRRERRGTCEPGRTEWWAAEPDVGGTPDGDTSRLDGGRLDAGPREVLRALWGATGTQAVQRTARGPWGVQEADLLLKSLHGKRICQRCATHRYVQMAGVEAPWNLLRGMWGEGEASRPSHRWECVEQLSREHPDVVHFLSRIPPPPCASCWSDGTWESSVSRTAHGVPSRMDRLRCLGNGVVPQCAELIGLRLQQLDSLSG